MPASWQRRPNASEVYWLAALVAVVHQPRVGSAVPDRHVEGVQHQLGA
jgi:hypothetical protein